MEDRIKKFVKDLYDYPKNNYLFTNFSFEQANLILANIIEKIFLYSCNPYLVKIDPGNLQDVYRAAYRQTLKDAYRFCSKKDISIPVITNDVEKQAFNEIERNTTFNMIRNKLDQYELNRCKIEEKDGVFYIKDINRKRSIDSFLYAKLSDNTKIDDYNSSNIDILQRGLAIIYNPIFCEYWDPINHKCKDYQYFKRIHRYAKEKVETEVEYNDNYNFGEFDTLEFNRVYSYLLTVSLFEINYHFHRTDIKNNPNILFIPLYDKDKLIKEISDYTKLKIEKVSKIIDILEYDPEYHKDKVTIIQPLYHFDNKIYFVPFLLFLGMQYEKIIYLCKKNQELINEISHDREEVMIEKIGNRLLNSPLIYKSNFKIIGKNNQPLSEIDMVIYDPINNVLLLAELKWYFKGDGEYDHKVQDDKISAEIEKRIIKEKIARDNINQLIKAFNILDKTGLEIFSCIISRNYSGSDKIDDKLPVYDISLFLMNLLKSGFNLKIMKTAVENDDYIVPLSDFINYREEKFDYAGYKIVMNMPYFVKE